MDDMYVDDIDLLLLSQLARLQLFSAGSHTDDLYFSDTASISSGTCPQRDSTVCISDILTFFPLRHIYCKVLLYDNGSILYERQYKHVCVYPLFL